MKNKLTLFLIICSLLICMTACLRLDNQSKSDKPNVSITPKMVATSTLPPNPTMLQTQASLPTASTLPTIQKERSISDISYRKYVNPRYGFSIDYPEEFTKGSEPSNGDGLKFTSPDSKAELAVYGSNNVFENTVTQAYQEDINRIGKNIAYKVLKDNWFVISYTDNGLIIYQKTVIGAGSINTFIFQYPQTQKTYYDSIISHINQSFHNGDVESVH